MNRVTIAVVLSALITAPACLLAEPVKLIHNWQNESEQKALSVLTNSLKKQSFETLEEIPPAEALTNSTDIKELAKASREQPSYLALTNEELRHWYDLRLLHSLSSVAEEQAWAEKVPQAVLDMVTHRGHIIAAPVSVHTSNWIWANKQLVDATGLPLDTDWTGFLDLLAALEQQNVMPIAHDGTQEQDLLLFESLYLSNYGADKYRLLFDELDPTALKKAEPDFTEVFNKLADLKPYIIRETELSNWQQSADKIVKNLAGIIIQGDWVHGEFARQGRISNQHFYCLPLPGEFETVALKVDAVASLNTSNYTLGATQKKLYNVVMDKDMQFLFNNYKGGLPAIADSGLAAISECMTYAETRTNDARANNTLVPSLSQGMAVREIIRNEIGMVITEFMTSNQTPAEAAAQLQKRIKYATYLIS